MYCMGAGSEADAATTMVLSMAPVLLQGAHDVGDRRHLLADGDVDTLNTGVLLIDDGVDGNRGLADLPIADDQLALPAADRHHGVDTL